MAVGGLRAGQLPAAVQNAWVDAFAGTPVAGMTGWVPVTGPLGLGLSIVSYAGQLPAGLASDAHLLPDHDRLLALLDDEVGALHPPTASSSPPERGADIPDRNKAPGSGSGRVVDGN